MKVLMVRKYRENELPEDSDWLPSELSHGMHVHAALSDLLETNKRVSLFDEELSMVLEYEFRNVDEESNPDKFRQPLFNKGQL